MGIKTIKNRGPYTIIISHHIYVEKKVTPYIITFLSKKDFIFSSSLLHINRDKKGKKIKKTPTRNGIHKCDNKLENNELAHGDYTCCYSC